MYPNVPYYSGPPIMSAPSLPPAHKVNTFATWSLVFAFVFAPVGIVLGHLGLAQIKRTGERGRDRALIGIVLSYVFTVIIVVALVIWVSQPEESIASAPTSAPATSTSAAAPSSTKPPAPVVTPAQFPGLLLTLDELKAQVKPFTSDYTAMDIATFNAAAGEATSSAGCLSMFYAGAVDAYENRDVATTLGRSITTLQVRTLLQMGGLEERITRYPDAATADAQAAKIEKIWQGCGGSVTHLTKVGPVNYDFAPVTRGAKDPSITVLNGTALSGPELLRGIHIQRAVAAKNNIVVDAMFLGADPGVNAEMTVAAILARIPD